MTLAKKIRVVIIDDSSFLRRNLPRILETDPEIQVVGAAANGDEGVRLVKELRPDVVTLDVMMPVMDGLTALRHIMRDAPTPVVMVSSATREGTQVALDALALGAVDFVAKPSGPISLDIEKVNQELIEKVKAAHTSKLRILTTMDATREKFRALAEQLAQGKSGPAPQPPRSSPAAVRQRKRLIAIASSTGGPAALQLLLPLLPAKLNAGLVIVQHIAPGFTRPLAERLDALTQITVKEAENDALITPGVALIAPADSHLTVAQTPQGLAVKLAAQAANSIYRPSANVLFSSIAATCAAETCAVILTGMGDDGAVGMREIYERGGHTIAQDENSSLIYGMPRRAVEMGGVAASLPLEKIANEIVKVCA